MKLKVMGGISVMVMCLLAGLQAHGEEADGKVTELGFNKFKMNVKGAERMFNSDRKTQYQPGTWRPEVGDEIKIEFNETKNRAGNMVLAVSSASLVKANPNSLTKLVSPMTVTIIDSGVTGIRARMANGQEIRFEVSRRSMPVKVPTGWVENAGDKAVVTFHTQAAKFTGKAALVADKIEKAQ